MKIFNIWLSCLVAVLVTADAQSEVRSMDADPEPFQLNSGFVATDNFNPTVSDDVNAYGLRINPFGSLLYKGEGAWTTFYYDLAYEKFTFSDDDEHSGNDTAKDFQLGLTSQFYIRPDFQVDLDLQARQHTEMFGTGISRLKAGVMTMDEYTFTSGKISFIGGNDTSRRAASLNIGANKYAYEQHNDYSALFDRTETLATLEYTERRSGKFHYLLHLEGRDVSYESIERDDSSDYALLAGFGWRPTGKSYFKLLVGGYQQRIDTQEDNSGMSWNVTYTHQYSDRSTVQVGSTQRVENSVNETTSDAVRTAHSILLKHAFTDQWQLLFKALISEFDFGGGEIDNLNDDSVMLGIGYMLNSRHQFDLNFQHRSLSSPPIVDYQQNEVSLLWHYVY